MIGQLDRKLKLVAGRYLCFFWGGLVCGSWFYFASNFWFKEPVGYCCAGFLSLCFFFVFKEKIGLFRVPVYSFFSLVFQLCLSMHQNPNPTEHLIPFLMAMSFYSHLEIADDPTLSEDAHFILDVAWPTETTDTVNYVGIADGVGSWRRVGVDPRVFRCVCVCVVITSIELLLF